MQALNGNYPTGCNYEQFPYVTADANEAIHNEKILNGEESLLETVVSYRKGLSENNLNPTEVRSFLQEIWLLMKDKIWRRKWLSDTDAFSIPMKTSFGNYTVKMECRLKVQCIFANTFFQTKNCEGNFTNDAVTIRNELNGRVLKLSLLQLHFITFHDFPGGSEKQITSAQISELLNGSKL